MVVMGRVLLLSLAAVAATLIALKMGSHSPPPRATASPAEVFVQDPYMGVSCSTPNSIACDRLGLAVWLDRPAEVTANVAGATLKLDDPRWSYITRQGGKPLYVYAGFLQPAGLTTRLHVVPVHGSIWLGDNAPTPRVRFRIAYRNSRIITTQERLWLHAGWG